MPSLGAPTKRGEGQDIDLRFIQVASRGKVVRNIAVPAMGLLLRNQQSSLDEFETAISSVVASRARKKRPAQEWRFVLPFQVVIDSEVTLPLAINVRGSQFVITTWGAEQITLTKENVRSLRVPPEGVPTDSISVLSVRGTSSDIADAWAAVQVDYDVLRGAIEFLNGFCRTSTSYPFPKALRQVPHPAWMVAVQDSTSEVTSHAFGVHPNDRQAQAKFAFTRNVAETLQRFSLSFMSNNSTEAQALIQDSLRLLGQSLDYPEPWQAFLGLWQLAEAITCSSSKLGSNKKTARRLAAIVSISDVEGQLSAILEDFGQSRNVAVHQGVHERIDQREVNFLKVCCDRGISWLIDSSGKLPTRKHLEVFFESHEKDDIELQAVVEATQVVIGNRTSNESADVSAETHDGEHNGN